MTQEHKELLFRDISGRLPYGVKAYVKNWSKLDRKYYEGVYTVESIHPSLNTVLVYSDKFSVEVIVGYDDYEIKPYLIPLSSMTEEQREEYYNLCSIGTDECGDIIYFDTYESIDYLNKNKFDYRGLIPMGLANDVTELNIY